jgi:hypothetical protein
MGLSVIKIFVFLGKIVNSVFFLNLIEGKRTQEEGKG